MLSVVIGQCTEAMKSRLESDNSYVTISKNSDIIKLLKLIRNSTYKYESQRYTFAAIHTSMKSFYHLFQRYHDLVDKHLETFSNQHNVTLHCGATIRIFDSLYDYILVKNGVAPSSADETEKENASMEAYKAIAFLCTLNKDHYQDMLDELVNLFLKGRYDYPKSLVVTHKLVTNWCGEQKPQRSNRSNVL